MVSLATWNQFHHIFKAATYLICIVSFPGFSKILWLIPCFHKGAMWRWNRSGQIYIFWLALKPHTVQQHPPETTGYTICCSLCLFFKKTKEKPKHWHSGALDLIRRGSSSTREAAMKLFPLFTATNSSWHWLGRNYHRTVCILEQQHQSFFHSDIPEEFWPSELSSKTFKIIQT